MPAPSVSLAPQSISEPTEAAYLCVSMNVTALWPGVQLPVQPTVTLTSQRPTDGHACVPVPGVTGAQRALQWVTQAAARWNEPEPAAGRCSPAQRGEGAALPNTVGCREPRSSTQDHLHPESWHLHRRSCRTCWHHCTPTRTTGRAQRPSQASQQTPTPGPPPLSPGTGVPAAAVVSPPVTGRASGHRTYRARCPGPPQPASWRRLSRCPPCGLPRRPRLPEMSNTDPEQWGAGPPGPSGPWNGGAFPACPGGGFVGAPPAPRLSGHGSFPV